MILKHTHPGAMLLTTVLLLGSAALTIALIVSLRGIGELDMGFADNQSSEALAVADACAEEALLRLNRDGAYNSGSLIVGDGSCTISVENTGGDNRRISVVATLAAWTHTLRVSVDTGDMSILEWVHE